MPPKRPHQSGVFNQHLNKKPGQSSSAPTSRNQTELFSHSAPTSLTPGDLLRAPLLVVEASEASGSVSTSETNADSTIETAVTTHRESSDSTKSSCCFYSRTKQPGNSFCYIYYPAQFPTRAMQNPDRITAYSYNIAIEILGALFESWQFFGLENTGVFSTEIFGATIDSKQTADIVIGTTGGIAGTLFSLRAIHLAACIMRKDRTPTQWDAIMQGLQTFSQDTLRKIIQKVFAASVISTINPAAGIVAVAVAGVLTVMDIVFDSIVNREMHQYSFQEIDSMRPTPSRTTVRWQDHYVKKAGPSLEFLNGIIGAGAAGSLIALTLAQYEVISAEEASLAVYLGLGAGAAVGLCTELTKLFQNLCDHPNMTAQTVVEYIGYGVNSIFRGSSSALLVLGLCALTSAPLSIPGAVVLGVTGALLDVITSKARHKKADYAQAKADERIRELQHIPHTTPQPGV